MLTNSLPWSLQEEVRLPGTITALPDFSLNLWVSDFPSVLFTFKQELLSPSWPGLRLQLSIWETLVGDVFLDRQSQGASRKKQSFNSPALLVVLSTFLSNQTRKIDASKSLQSGRSHSRPFSVSVHLSTNQEANNTEAQENSMACQKV